MKRHFFGEYPRCYLCGADLLTPLRLQLDGRVVYRCQWDCSEKQAMATSWAEENAPLSRPLHTDKISAK